MLYLNSKLFYVLLVILKNIEYENNRTIYELGKRT